MPKKLSLLIYSNKQNQIHATPTKIKLFDSSLAEELEAIRKKLERLRLDKQLTETKLKAREMILDMQITDLYRRGEVQMQLEIELDRLFRLKELKSYCMRISPIRSLREKEQEKKEHKPEENEESEDENSRLQSPIPLSSDWLQL